jgi:signal transduction histidine kinase
MIDKNLKSSNILIVDDQHANVDILESYLEMLGFTNLCPVTDSREVLPLMDTFQPDMILLDLMMPHLNGFEVMAQIRQKLPSDYVFPILVLTADITSEAKQKALSEGATDFITKPFDLTEVGLRIKNMLFSTYLQQQLKNQNQLLEEKVKERTSELLQMNHELILAKDKAEASDRLKTAFIQNISHEIRTPLNGLIGFSNLMADETLSAEEKKKIIPMMHLSGERLVKTIGDYVDIAKIVSGNMDVNKEQIGVTNLMYELMSRYQRLCSEKGLTLNANFPKNTDLTIQCDPVHLRSILWQLMDNAIKFTSSGSISLILKEEGEHLSLKLTDTGIGIKEDELEKIFDLFMQRDVSSTRRHEGNGLGLSIVKGLLDLLGGDIRIESEAGEGTTVTLTIPK